MKLLPFVSALALFLSLAVPAKAELTEAQQQRLSEILEAYFTAASFDYRFVELVNYTDQNGLVEKDVMAFVRDWGVRNWKRIWQQTVDAVEPVPLASPSDPQVANSNELPHELVRGDRWLRLLTQDRAMTLDELYQLTPEDLRVLRLLLLIEESGALNELPELLRPYQDRLPPTQQDLFIARTTVILIECLNDRAMDIRTNVVVWEPLVCSKNAMYRYLALKAVGMAIPDRLQQYCAGYDLDQPELYYYSAYKKYGVYQRYYDDPSELIRLSLYGSLSNLPIPEPLDYLQAELERRQQALPPEELKELAARSSENTSPVDPFAPRSADPTAPDPFAPKTEKVSPDRFAVEFIRECISDVKRNIARVPDKYKAGLEASRLSGDVYVESGASEP